MACFNILHMDLHLCGTLYTPEQVLDDSSLVLGHKNMILLISTTEHQIN